MSGCRTSTLFHTDEEVEPKTAENQLYGKTYSTQNTVDTTRVIVENKILFQIATYATNLHMRELEIRAAKELGEFSRSKATTQRINERNC